MSRLLARLHARETDARASSRHSPCWPFDDASTSTASTLPPRLLPSLDSLAVDAPTLRLVRGCVVLGWSADGGFLLAHTVKRRRRRRRHSLVLLAVDAAADGGGTTATLATMVPLFLSVEPATLDEAAGESDNDDDDDPTDAPPRLTGGLAIHTHQVGGLLCVYGRPTGDDGDDSATARVALTVLPLPPPRDARGWRLVPAHAAYVADMGRVPSPPVCDGGGGAIVACVGAEGVELVRVCVSHDAPARTRTAILHASAPAFDAAPFASAALAPVHRLTDLGVALASLDRDSAVAVVVARAAAGRDVVLLASLSTHTPTVTPLAALPPPPGSAAAPPHVVADAVATALAARWRLPQGSEAGLSNEAALRGVSLEALVAAGAPVGVRL